MFVINGKRLDRKNLSYIGMEFLLACVAQVSMSAASAKQDV